MPTYVHVYEYITLSFQDITFRAIEKRRLIAIQETLLVYLLLYYILFAQMKINSRLNETMLTNQAAKFTIL